MGEVAPMLPELMPGVQATLEMFGRQLVRRMALRLAEDLDTATKASAAQRAARAPAHFSVTGSPPPPPLQQAEAGTGYSARAPTPKVSRQRSWDWLDGSRSGAQLRTDISSCLGGSTSTTGMARMHDMCGQRSWHAAAKIAYPKA
ncbi:protein kinase domain-containing protein [Haematococcus lacustris]|uniref:Protein kinase domain-containing protein n=1 Tax=Haematococcus lacustris TaxID=44745 RepID=A0A6A0ABX0_HAELA|nr:protein kinase domain-containing protein [Haematococcus lacustris]